VIIIPDDHEPPIDAGHRSEQTSGTPQVLGERLRWVQRAGLGLAAIGILLITA
jgi:hypothetical protein